MRESKCRGLTIRRYPDAGGTNLADQSQPVVRVTGQGLNELIGRWTTLCLPAGSVTADKATDQQIADAMLSDESIFD